MYCTDAQHFGKSGWGWCPRARGGSRTCACLCARLVGMSELVGFGNEATGVAGQRPRAGAQEGCHPITYHFQHVRLLMEISPHTFFFFEIIFRSGGGMCVSMASFGPEEPKIPHKMASLNHIFLHRMEIFFSKKSMGRYLHEQAHMLVKGIYF